MRLFGYPKITALCFYCSITMENSHIALVLSILLLEQSRCQSNHPIWSTKFVFYNKLIAQSAETRPESPYFSDFLYRMAPSKVFMHKTARIKNLVYQ